MFCIRIIFCICLHEPTLISVGAGMHTLAVEQSGLSLVWQTHRGYIMYYEILCIMTCYIYQDKYIHDDVLYIMTNIYDMRHEHDM